MRRLVPCPNATSSLYWPWRECLWRTFCRPSCAAAEVVPWAHRTSIAKAFLARMIFQIPTTTALRERLLMDRILRSLCGWPRGCDVPSESIFSQVFQEFSESELPPRIHEALIRSCYKNEVMGHISRDSTAIEVREAAVKEEEEEKAPQGPPMLNDSERWQELTRWWMPSPRSAMSDASGMPGGGGSLG